MMSALRALKVAVEVIDEVVNDVINNLPAEIREELRPAIEAHAVRAGLVALFDKAYGCSINPTQEIR